MCRLFGLRAAAPVRATFWLLDAPDSLLAQSRRDPDGAGIGVFDADGHAVVDKRPMAAFRDREFAEHARTLTSSTFVAHVRYASTGGLTAVNTHPFSCDGRLFAHNGAFSGLDVLDRHLAELNASDLVLGQTDSERMFALITMEIRRHAGDVESGLLSAVRWVSDHLPVYSLNLLLAAPGALWALRYPATNELHVLQRNRSEGRGSALQARSRRINAVSEDLAEADAVILASEPMDADPGWRGLQSGELLSVGAGCVAHSSFPLPAGPRYPLTLADLDAVAGASQRPTR